MLLIVAISCLLIGMACPFIAFIVFKPVLMDFTRSISNNKRVMEDSVVDKVFNRVTGLPEFHEKAPKKAIVKPKRDIDEGDN